ncbi:MAG: CvpA family protein [Tabrizicola sp.]|nr:CvpA family protein [Tabrizicola sp.]
MENLTAVDGGAALIVLISAVLAYSRGLVRELLAILGWIGAAVVAYIFTPSAQPIVKEIPVIGDFLTESCELSVVAAFAGVFAIALIIAAIFTPLFSSAVQRSALGGIDQALGFLFGALRGIVLIAVAFIVYDRVLANQAIAMVDDSRTAKVFANFQQNIDQYVPADAPGWIVARYNDLTDICVAGGSTPSPRQSRNPRHPPPGIDRSSGHRGEAA